ncbi:hypothetical protein [Archangium sp.]|uniref:hypothetical protein n=1 Tax=Archangium sp. TaxID=1872627 RepID=UPI002D6CBD68|nr:hypothetical protein [Archangium sp.]HYO53866.1 hypothetical protein [Archangium sp.]
MRVQRMVLSLSLALTGLSGCDVYERWDGEDVNAGPVDAQNFPPDYLGAGANRQRAGSGSFTGARAYAQELALGHYLFSFSNSQLTAKAPLTPLTVRTGDKAVSAVPTPSAYVFDPASERPQCKAPEGYEFDAQRDDVPHDDQGIIFTALPATTYTPGVEPTWSYVPVISQVPVESGGQSCQGIKSEKSLVARQDVRVPLTTTASGKQVGTPDGTFRALAIIEPGAAVYRYTSTSTARDPATGVGLQKWGWYNQYLLAYLDGGTIPTQEVTVGGTTQVRMVTQKLYYPRSKVTVSTTQGLKDLNVSVGQGYDVVEAIRGEPGYSPVCEVFTYDAGGPLTADQLPKSAAEVVAKYGATLQKPVKNFGDRSPVGDAYVYCLQVE